MKKFLFLLILSAIPVYAQAQNDGVWEGYDGELTHVTKQPIELAEATPADKFAWRPAPGVRSTSEVYMHIAIANFYLLSVTGLKEPEVTNKLEKTVTSKADVIDWLKRSLEAVKAARAQLKPGDLERKVKIGNKVVVAAGCKLRTWDETDSIKGALDAAKEMDSVGGGGCPSDRSAHCANQGRHTRAYPEFWTGRLAAGSVASYGRSHALGDL
jgi:hypothetical protein